MRTSLRAAAALAVIAWSGCAGIRPAPPDVVPEWTPPPGAVPVALLSDTVKRRWDVYVNEQYVCTTPCKRALDPAQPLLLHEHGKETGDEVKVPNLFPAAREGPVALHLSGTNDSLRGIGSWVTITGILPAILGGILAPAVCGYTLSHGESPGPCLGFAAAATGGFALWGTGIGLFIAGSPKPAVTPSREYLKAGGAY